MLGLTRAGLEPGSTALTLQPAHWELPEGLSPPFQVSSVSVVLCGQLRICSCLNPRHLPSHLLDGAESKAEVPGVMS